MREAWRFRIIERLARGRVPLGFFCAAAVLYLARPTPSSLVIGGAVAAAGEAIRVWAAGHLHKGREVTRSGPYRLMRHPLYAGSAILALGAVVAANTLGGAIIVGVYVAVAIGAAMRHEERNMRRQFGGEYDEYLGSRASPSARRFSFDRAMKINHEYKAILGLLVLIAILAVKVVFAG